MQFSELIQNGAAQVRKTSEVLYVDIDLLQRVHQKKTVVRGSAVLWRSRPALSNLLAAQVQKFVK